ncbi:glycoside hydrolase domain-containing protein [Spirilliplanes yamanashiensis]|uniref:Rv2525c-like glycoside hydrolase-like domain-containing protein n=1 Tax=Spirilliplanes yamanashiensis TaxID=42233 RepID=A0A8J3YDB4_9ACTN|nr:glycoside hydrolase domain-containing protein [Spirilliplanes yamanashiensis]MDP9815234.1 hypothetical protein [Spirilliplanes yamanashiensis]GIJ06498.1 hypothetical protein Sya03_58500 [Spirilliplanes yamanashiensis]
MTGPQPGTYAGPAFDACTAPSNAQMTAWLKSPYRAMVVYIGGKSRGCKQPNLTASWVKTQNKAGWRLIPIYVGPQAPCTYSKAKHKISTSTPVADAQTAATDAADQAKKLGLARDSVIIYNLERYRTGDAACKKAVLAFLSAWTAKLHDLSYLSGVYSEMTSGIPDLVGAYRTAGFVRPDYIDFARWDNVATVDDAAIPADMWAPKRRMKQYRGPHKETWGDVTINIDNDHLDMATLPATRTGDVTGNGWSDLVTVHPTTGVVDLWSGNGTTLARKRLTTTVKGMDAVTRTDFNRDGRDDLIAREKATGYLWLHPGTATGLGARVRIATGWKHPREITAVGDLTGDGNPDLVAVDPATGRLILHPGLRTRIGAGIRIGNSGWNGMDELTGAGDIDGDGTVDLIARVKSTGVLRLYPGRRNALATPKDLTTTHALGAGITGVGDFDRDGIPDVMAVDTTGAVHRFAVTGRGFGPRIRITTGLKGLIPS